MATKSIIILLTLAYLGLPIIGWGGVSAFFSHPALAVLAVSLLLMTVAALFSEGNLSARSTMPIAPAPIGSFPGFIEGVPKRGPGPKARH